MAKYTDFEINVDCVLYLKKLSRDLNEYRICKQAIGPYLKPIYTALFNNSDSHDDRFENNVISTVEQMLEKAKKQQAA